MLSLQELMAKNYPIPILILVILFISDFVKSQPLKCSIPPELVDKLHVDSAAIESASTDFGNIVHNKPAAVLYPSSIQDISSLIQASFNCSTPFGIAVRGAGHSPYGQDMALNGVVIDMKALRESKNGVGIKISKDRSYADVGGEQLWSDVFNKTMSEQVAPLCWTGFLGLSVGGTLSNAGIGGQTFRFGPEIRNVLEMDVITGKGEFVTCSRNNNSELFYGVLGGLGQFGVITRARITLGPSFEKVVRVKILYSNFTAFTRDGERYIATNAKKNGTALISMEGAILLDNGNPIRLRIPPSDLLKVQSLVKKYGVLYNLQISNSYINDLTNDTALTKLEDFIKSLSAQPEYIQREYISNSEFFRTSGVPDDGDRAHPWMLVQIPRSKISVYNSGVIRNIILQRNITVSPVTLLPLSRSKWDDRMSAPIVDEEIFYIGGFLHSTAVNDWQRYQDQNKAVIDFLDAAGIQYKLYLLAIPRQGRILQFGPKWTTFEQRKSLFDPKKILSPGQGIFNDIKFPPITTGK